MATTNDPLETPGRGTEPVQPPVHPSVQARINAGQYTPELELNNPGPQRAVNPPAEPGTPAKSVLNPPGREPEPGANTPPAEPGTPQQQSRKVGMPVAGAEWIDKSLLEEYGASLEKISEETKGDPAAIQKRLLESLRLAREKRIVPPGPQSRTEDIVAYREAAGIPDDPKDYPFEPPEGAEIDENFKAAFLEMAKENNLTPHQVKQQAEWYFAQQQAFERQIAEAEAGRVKELQTEWGTEYQSRVERAMRFADAMPKELHPALQRLDRDPDLFRILDHFAGERAEPSQPIAGATTAGGPNTRGGMIEKIGNLYSELSKIPDPVGPNREQTQEFKQAERIRRQIYELEIAAGQISR